MKVARSIAEVRAAVAEARREGAQVGFVPTMGYLHEGHLSLIDAARANGASCVVVSIFVNPTQFGPHEDFEKYPRDEARDRALLESRGVEVLFAPDVAEIYPRAARTTVHVSGLAAALEGGRRPGHFDGVATVVTKLFNIVQPDVAVFGQKDAQQCAVIAALVRDLDLPIRLVIAPTMREADGLAMSSRNAYLSVEQRAIAPALHRALQAGAEAIATGSRNVAVIEEAMRAELARTAGIELDYLHLVDGRSFERPQDFTGDLVLAGAARLGSTRIIDNIPVSGAAHDPYLSPLEDSPRDRDGSERGVRGVHHDRPPLDERGRARAV
jgi:pantoate--beta-alanine ligase